MLHQPPTAVDFLHPILGSGQCFTIQHKFLDFLHHLDLIHPALGHACAGQIRCGRAARRKEDKDKNGTHNVIVGQRVGSLMDDSCEVESRELE